MISVVGAQQEKCWQDPHDRQTRRKLRHPQKLHVWGGIGHYFKTKLHFFRENLDAELLNKILQKQLPPHFSPDCPARKQAGWLFIQDNDPKHKSEITTELLDSIAPDRIRDHPSNSPDFNCMEDAWSYLDSEVKKKNIKSIEELKKALLKSWKDLPWEHIRKSVASMPHRLQQCVKRKGQRTDY